MKQYRAAIYVRVARKDQARKYGPEAQFEKIRDAVQRLELQEPALAFEDHASANDEATRIDLERAIAGGAGGRYRLLLLARINRLARDDGQVWNYLDRLISGGACVYFVDEDVCAGLDEHWRDAVSLQIQSAAEFSRKISRYVRKANWLRRQRGEWTRCAPRSTRKPSGGGAR